MEAARAFGASPLQIVQKVLLSEAMSAVTLALTLTIVSLLGYSAMVGAVGGGGLGDLGIRYGYQTFMPEVMATVVLVLIVLVQGGKRWSKRSPGGSTSVHAIRELHQITGIEKSCRYVILSSRRPF